MNGSQNWFQTLPLELRQQIYSECFDSAPQPGLLSTNKLIHHEATHFLQRWQQTFSFNISVGSIGFDEFSQWCFKVKGHIPRLNRIKHLILNIYPPDPDKPIEMCRLWNHLLSFCKDLASFRRIPRLSIKFVESDTVKWPADEPAHNTMGLAHADSSLDVFSIDQYLPIFFHFVDNVEKPKIYFPQSYIRTHPRIITVWSRQTERRMAGKLTAKKQAWNELFQTLDNYVKGVKPLLKHDTGRISKVKFEKAFGQNVVLDYEAFRNSRRLWPHMKTLADWEGPRTRLACSQATLDCPYDCNLVEITMPDPTWGANNQFSVARRWQKNTVEMDGGCGCARYRQRHFIPPPEELPRWCYGEELERRLFPYSVQQADERMKLHKKKKRGGAKKAEKAASV